jgi:hypothetical protein
LIWNGGTRRGKGRKMNLLEHYIINIISEEKKISQHSTEYINAKMIVDCYGVVEQTEHLFLPSEWE